MSLGAIISAGLEGERHRVTVEDWLKRQQRLARELREADHPLAALAQQQLEDIAYLLRRHLDRPCAHWNGEAHLPGKPE